MGKKRIKIMGAEETPKKKTKTGLPGETSLPGDKASRRLVKSGKEHGRITDMGAVALAEAERIKKKEKELEKLAAVKVKAKKKRVTKKPVKKRGKRYLAVRKQVDPTKLYPLSEAIKLVKKTSIARFNGRVEVHLVTREKGLKKRVQLPHKIGKQTHLEIATEKKAPLIHLVIGEINSQDTRLAENFQTIIEAVGRNNIKKAVLTSTMGPGVKVDLTGI